MEESTTKYIEGNDKLLAELIAYRFPDGGGEYIKTQYERHKYIFENIKSASIKQQYLYDNETVSTHGFFDLLIGYDDMGKPRYVTSFERGDVLTKNQISNLYNPTHKDAVTVIHHNDLDGITSAAIVAKMLKPLCDMAENKSVSFFKYNYNPSVLSTAFKGLNTLKFDKYFKIAIVVDLSLRSEELSTILMTFDKVIWIDHHQVAMEDLINNKIPVDKSLSCVIDTRYSASYITYTLFRDLIKTRAKMNIDELFPALVSMMDNSQSVLTKQKYISVKVTKENAETLKGQQYVVRRDQKQKFILSNPNKLMGKDIFIENKIVASKEAFPEGSKLGFYINYYFKEIGEISPYYSEFFDRVFTNRNAIENVLNMGKQICDIDRQKLEILTENDIVYSALHLGKSIKGLSYGDWSHFFTVKSNANKTFLLMKYKNFNSIVVYFKTNDPILRDVGINQLLADWFENDSFKLGHNGTGMALFTIGQMENYLRKIKTNKLDTILTDKCPRISEIYSKTLFKIESKNPFNLKYDVNFAHAFKLVSAIILSAWQNHIQKMVQNG